LPNESRVPGDHALDIHAITGSCITRMGMIIPSIFVNIGGGDFQDFVHEPTIHLTASISTFLWNYPSLGRKAFIHNYTRTTNKRILVIKSSTNLKQICIIVVSMCQLFTRALWPIDRRCWTDRHSELLLAWNYFLSNAVTPLLKVPYVYDLFI